jgi:hypothetical protein
MLTTRQLFRARRAHDTAGRAGEAARPSMPPPPPPGAELERWRHDLARLQQVLDRAPTGLWSPALRADMAGARESIERIEDAFRERVRAMRVGAAPDGAGSVVPGAPPVRAVHPTVPRCVICGGSDAGVAYFAAASGLPGPVHPEPCERLWLEEARSGSERGVRR